MNVWSDDASAICVYKRRELWFQLSVRTIIIGKRRGGRKGKGKGVFQETGRQIAESSEIGNSTKEKTFKKAQATRQKKSRREEKKS